MDANMYGRTREQDRASGSDDFVDSDSRDKGEGARGEDPNLEVSDTENEHYSAPEKMKQRTMTTGEAVYTKRVPDDQESCDAESQHNMKEVDKRDNLIR